MTDTKLVGVTPLSAPISPGDDSRDEWPSHRAKWGQGGLKVVKTIADRDAITPARRFNSMVLVLSDDDGYANCYVWMGDDEDGVKGKWEETALPGGIIIADTNGALPSKVKTLVLGPGLSVQKAGDQESGALITIDDNGGPSYLNIHMAPPNEQYGEGDVNEITVMPPLNVWADPDKEHGLKMEVKPGTFEPIHAPSFLAYLSEEELIIGKHGSARGHHDGALWFDDVVWPSGPYIELKRDNKTYGIQEADDLDPNVSGGMDYLIAFRASMKGKAPNDGFVRIYLYDSKTPWEDGKYMLDKNGQPMVVERQYKAGDKLGSLDLMGIVNAKGMQEFTCHVVDNFSDDELTLTGRYEGATGLMIQALTKDAKTGMGLLQFQSDTKQNILFNTHYMGEGQFDLTWLASQDMPMQTGKAGQALSMADGVHFNNRTDMKMGVVDKNIVFQDDGKNICDFTFGKVFSAEKTKLLRGKSLDIEVTVTLENRNSGWAVSLMKWIGKPDEYSNDIITSRSNGSPVFNPDWVKAGSFFISEDVVNEEHTVTHSFTVPADANNYAVIIYPVSPQQPLTLKLKQFKVDVKNPFYGYVLYAPELLHEVHLINSERHKRFVQDNRGFAALRYTINNAANGLPMPCGVPSIGEADIIVDGTVNQVSGSAATEGEGALLFQKDGKATVKTQVRLWNEQKSASTVTFWWGDVGPDGSVTKIADSETTVTIGGSTQNSLVVLTPFTINVEAGNRIALRASADKADGAFIEGTSLDKPLVQVDVTFDELVPSVL